MNTDYGKLVNDIIQFWVKTLTVLALLIGGIVIMMISKTVVSTTIDLADCYLTGLSIKEDTYYSTPAEREPYDELYRENSAKWQSIHDSDNMVVRMYSEASLPLQILSTVVALVNMAMVPAMWLRSILNAYYNWKKSRKVRIQRAKRVAHA